MAWVEGGGGVGVRQARGPLTLSSRLPLATDLMLCLGIPDLLQHVVGSVDNTATTHHLTPSPSPPSLVREKGVIKVLSAGCPGSVGVKDINHWSG